MNTRGSIGIADIERILWEIQDELSAARMALKKPGGMHDLYLYGEATIEDAHERLLGKPMTKRPRIEKDQS